MAFTSVLLTDPVTGYTSTLMPRDGVSVSSLDVQPTARTVAEEQVGHAGQYDTTVWLSAAAVTLSLMLWVGDTGWTPEQMLDEIGPLLAPWTRPYLVCTNDQWAQARQLTVRFSGSVKPIDNPITLPVALSWSAVNGIWEAASESEYVIPAFVTAAAGFAVTTSGLASSAPVGGSPGGLQVTAGASTGEPVITSGGNIQNDWQGKLYGPCTGPKFANDTTGQTLEFGNDVVLLAGEYIQLDSSTHTAYRNGDVTQPVLGSLKFNTSDWWLIQPGSNSVRYYPTIANAGSVAVVDFRPAWMA